MKSLYELPLYTEQKNDAAWLRQVLERRGAALDGGDTGVGKTWTACGVAYLLDRPTLAVVPKISISDWKDVAARVGVEMDVFGWEKLRTGRTPYGWWDHPLTDEGRAYKCARCQETLTYEEVLDSQCRCDPEGGHTVTACKHTYGKFNWHRGIGFLIFDEVHRANAMQSLSAEMLIAAKRQQITTLALSATPAASPLHFRGLGYLLGMHQLTGDAGFYAWSKGLGCGKHPNPLIRGWRWLAPKELQTRIMVNLSKQLFPAFGVRTRSDDIPNFPKRQIQASLLDLGPKERINQLYEQMRESLERLKDRMKEDVDPEGPLTVYLRARQEVELLKVPAVVELAQDYLEKGYAVAVFVNFSDTMKEMRQRLRCDCYIDGTQTGKPEVRRKHMRAFQDNEERAIIVNCDAGGECCNLQDIHGDFPCVGLMMPPKSARTFRQVAGRLHRHGGKSLALYRVIFAAGTNEVESHHKLSQALNNIDSLMDGDLVPDNLSDLV